MKVAIFGDLFVRAAILEAALRQTLGPRVAALALTSCELSYPVTPALYSAELREFYGSEQQVLDLACDADLILCHMPPLSAAVLQALPRLRAIGCTRTEPVNVNVLAATALGIPIFYAPGRNAQAVAEFTVGLLIAETRNIRACAPVARGGRVANRSLPVRQRPTRAARADDRTDRLRQYRKAAARHAAAPRVARPCLRSLR